MFVWDGHKMTKISKHTTKLMFFQTGVVNALLSLQKLNFEINKLLFYPVSKKKLILVYWWLKKPTSFSNYVGKSKVIRMPSTYLL